MERVEATLPSAGAQGHSMRRLGLGLVAAFLLSGIFAAVSTPIPKRFGLLVLTRWLQQDWWFSCKMTERRACSRFGKLDMAWAGARGSEDKQNADF